MRTARVVTNRRCNQNCAFCTERSAVDDRALIRRDAVEGLISRAVDGGASELVLTGGEPTLRRDLAELVAFARKKAPGRLEIVLETNGSRLDADAAAELRRAGVDTFRLHVPAFGPALDAIVRDEGAFDALRRALSAILATDATLEIAVPIVRGNLHELAHVPEALGPAVARIRVLRVSVPTRAPEPSELVSFDEAGAALLALEASARRGGLSVKLADGSGPPPCTLPKRNRPNQLWSLTGHAKERDDRVRVPECERCLVREQCSGLDKDQVARFGLPTIEPVVEDRVRRRLALIATVEEQIAREFVTHDRARDPVAGLVDEDIIRVQFHCNQSCSFCFVSTHLPPAGHDAVLTAIDHALARGAKVVLSGGEPTLSPKLAEYVNRASRGGTLPMQLQTNAVRLDDPELVQTLVGAGLREAFVSLHGADAAISDAITGAPGTHARTLSGLSQLTAAGVSLTINFVICDSNASDFPAFVDLVAARWPKAVVNVSFVAPSTDVVPRDRELVPRYSDVLPHLAEGLQRAERAALDVRGFESMCGVPLCLLPPSLARFASIAEVPAGSDRGEFVYAEACGGCSARERCFGVRRGYVELHGALELSPVASGG